MYVCSELSCNRSSVGDSQGVMCYEGASLLTLGRSEHSHGKETV